MSNNIASTTPKKEKTVEKQMATETTSDDDMLYSLDLLILGDSVADGASEMLHQTFLVVQSTQKFLDIVQKVFLSFKHILIMVGMVLVLFTLLEQMVRFMIFLPKIKYASKDKPMFILTIRAPYEQWSDDNNEKSRNFVMKTIMFT